MLYPEVYIKCMMYDLLLLYLGLYQMHDVWSSLIVSMCVYVSSYYRGEESIWCVSIHILLWREYVLNMHHIFSQQYWYHTFCPSTVIDQLLDWNVQVRTSQRPVGWRSLVIVPIYVFSLHCYPRKPDKHLFGGVTPPPLSHHLMDDREQGNISRLICWFDYQNQAF